MKTKLTMFLVVAGLLQAATGEAQLATGVTLTNLQGQVYNNITIDHTNKLGVIWKGADGSMGQIKYNELAMECWVKLNLSDSAQKYDEATLQQEQEQKARLAQGEFLVTEFRMVGKVKYDVSKPPFMVVTIPAGSALENADSIRLTNPVGQISVSFQIPAIYNSGLPIHASVRNFPYNPSNFIAGFVQTDNRYNNSNRLVPHLVNGIVTRVPMTLRVFPLSHPITNWTALGEMRIIPAQPAFDYGLPL